MQESSRSKNKMAPSTSTPPSTPHHVYQIQKSCPPAPMKRKSRRKSRRNRKPRCARKLTFLPLPDPRGFVVEKKNKSKINLAQLVYMSKMECFMRIPEAYENYYPLNQNP